MSTEVKYLCLGTFCLSDSDMLVVCRKLKIPWKITYSVSVNAFAMESHGDWDSLEQIGTI